MGLIAPARTLFLQLRMPALVERMLELNKQKHALAAIYDRRKVGERSSPLQLEREIAATDVEIDNLVYELYGITAEEREIVEGNPAPRSRV